MELRGQAGEVRCLPINEPEPLFGHTVQLA
jgi:hypothetical protein